MLNVQRDKIALNREPLPKGDLPKCALLYISKHSSARSSCTTAQGLKAELWIEGSWVRVLPLRLTNSMTSGRSLSLFEAQFLQL